MTTVEERLGVIESQLADVLDRLDGGTRTSWDRSIRGRLHAVTNTLDSADKLAEALREVRRERSQRWTRTERLAALLFAAVTVTTPYVLLLLHA